MKYLSFDFGEVAAGVTTLEAMASTDAWRDAEAMQEVMEVVMEEVMAEVQQVLDWAWCRFPHSHGPADDGHDWDHELQLTVEQGRWHTVTLTLTGSPHFVAEFLLAFGGAG